MTNQLVLAPPAPESREEKPLALTPAQALLRKLVLDSVSSPHSQRNYAKALDDLFAFCASRLLTRSLLMEWRAGMDLPPPPPINSWRSPPRHLVWAPRRGNINGPAEEASLTQVPTDAH